MEPFMDTRVGLPTPSLPRRIGRGIYRCLEFLALAGAIAGAVFGYLTWVSPDQGDAARNTGKLVQLYAQMLEQEEQRLVLDRAVLASIERLFPEAELTRLGIEKLAKLMDSRIEDVREERGRLKAGIPPRSASGVTSWWSPDSPASRKAKEIFDKIKQP
jgi:hypothetical protein